MPHTGSGGSAPAARRPRLLLRAALLGGIPLVVMTAIGAYLLHEGRADDGRSTLAVGVLAVVGILLAAGLVLWATLYLVMTAVERRRDARAVEGA
jgi:zinc transporter ZupT